MYPHHVKIDPVPSNAQEWHLLCHAIRFVARADFESTASLVKSCANTHDYTLLKLFFQHTYSSSGKPFRLHELIKFQYLSPNDNTEWSSSSTAPGVIRSSYYGKSLLFSLKSYRTLRSSISPLWTSFRHLPSKTSSSALLRSRRYSRLTRISRRCS